MLGTVSTAPKATFVLPIPNRVRLLGATLNAQGAALDPREDNPLSVLLTNTIDFTIADV
ncbi:MAG: hypothetical protein AAF196_20795 [Planctomycetota bacterium]